MFSSMLSLLGSLRGGSSFVTNSLRFRSSASAYLSRTFGLGNRKTWTWSGWVKRGAFGSIQCLFGHVSSPTAYPQSVIRFTASDTLQIVENSIGPTIVWDLTTSQVFRDPSAWYHIVVSFDTTQTTANSRIRFFVNGTEITAFSSRTNPSLNYDGPINNSVAHGIGANFPFTPGSFFDGYITEINFVDGQALTPASFGAINSSTGVWAPSRYTGTYGTNGFYLKFANTSSVAALGNDSSVNGNNWTPNNISVTAGFTYDSMIDVPVNYNDGGNGRGNYAVLSPIDKAGAGAVAAGNLNYGTSTGSLDPIRASIAVSSGKWYWEVFCVSSFGDFLNDYHIGIIDSSVALSGSSYIGQNLRGYAYIGSSGNKVNNATSASYGSTYTTNDIIGVALDLDAGTITFYKNNVSQGIAYSGLIGTFAPAFSDSSFVSGTNVAFNFGQRPFTYTPPAGFRALNTQNLPTPSIVNGANFMAATTYTGDATARSLLNTVNNVSFQPDLVWIKSRTPGATSHALFDSVRGTTKYLSSDTTAAETTLAQSLTAFNADGFSLGTDTTLVNANANSYIAWQWKESALAGLDVVSYTGTGVDRTVAHNLGVAPAMVIVKRSQTGGTGNWQVRHTSIAAANSIQLSSVNTAAAAPTVWNSTLPTSSVFSIGTSADVNTSGANYIAYCFAEIAGFSKFGSYTGNGVNDGPFVFCGFRPRYILLKRFDSAATASWVIRDSSRNIFNPADNGLWTNLIDAELDASYSIDIVSNGFKIRAFAAEVNASAGTYIFAAFAETPSKYALAR